MEDRFFLSGYDIQVLIDWINEVRQITLALNLYTENTSSSFYSRTAAEFLENNRLKTLDYYIESQKEQDIQNNKSKNLISTQEKIATEVIAENVLNQLLLDKFLEADRVSIQQKYNEIIQPEATEEKVRALVPERNNQTGYSNQFTTSDNAELNVQIPSFPIFGEPYDNHMQEITSDMISRESFKVFTGASDVTNPSETLFKGWAKLKPGGTLEVNNSNTFTPDKPYSEYINNLIKESDSISPVGSYKFFIEKLHGRYSNGAPYKKNKIKSTKEQNKIPIELSNRMVFSAYINNYNDSYNLTKSDYNFIGRAEGVPVYKETKRSMTLEFSILADHSAEMMVAMSEFYRTTQNLTPNNIDEQLEQIVKNFPDWGLGTMPQLQLFNGSRVGSHIPGLYSDTPESLWYKLNFLSQCVYPYYRSDGKLKEQPMIRVRIADFYDVTGMITSYSLDLNELEGIQIDLNPSSIGNIPLAVKVTLSMDIYHDFEVNSNYFGFYHRKEFDEGTIDPVTGEGMLGTAKERIDQTKENIKKNSPAEIFNTIKNEGLLDTPSFFNENAPTLKKEISTLQNNLQDIINAGIKISDAVLNSRTKKAMQTYARIQRIINLIRIQNGYDTVDTNTDINSFGTATPTIFKGNNTNQSIKEQITNLNSLSNPNINLLKENYTDIISNAKTNIDNVANSLKNINNSVDKIGIESKVNSTLEDFELSAVTQKYKQVIPRTIGDIISDITKKDGPDQDK